LRVIIHHRRRAGPAFPGSLAGGLGDLLGALGDVRRGVLHLVPVAGGDRLAHAADVVQHLQRRLDDAVLHVLGAAVPRVDRLGHRGSLR
jgi:hypothetical protein